MKIKICGLNPTRDVQTCINSNVNFLGFVFYNKSPRNTDLKEIGVLKKYNPKRIVIFSRDEMKQWEMAKGFSGGERVCFFFGDVRGCGRVYRAFERGG